MDKIQTFFRRSIPVSTKSREIIVPVYSFQELREKRCSSFARKAAKDIFGLEYSLSSAWDRRYFDQVKQIFSRDSNLEELYKLRLISEGMIVGINYPNSSYSEKRDISGRKVEYTHNGLILGLDKSEKLLISDQFGATIRVKSVQEMRNQGLSFVEALLPLQKAQQ